MKPVRRTNASNTGKFFEKELALTLAAYERQGTARLRKVDPPVRMIGGGRGIIQLPNPFLDYVGALTARGGRAVFIEAKSTAGARLPVGGKDGLTGKQVEALRAWHSAGALVGLLWRRMAGEEVVRVFTVGDVNQALSRGALSLRPEDGAVCRQGTGYALWDFLPVLAGRAAAEGQKAPA